MYRIERVMANAIVGQVLPEGVIKGGTGMKLRHGTHDTRFTPDLDTARANSLTIENYADELAANLATGWAGFTGTLEQGEPAQPKNAPEDYIMQPYKIRLNYRGSAWVTVTLEVGHDEVGSTEEPETEVAEAVLELFDQVGLPRPDNLSVIHPYHQIAQKLHACTSVTRTGQNERAHDLVDLQIDAATDPKLDYAKIKVICMRLFTSRKAQPWPPTVVQHHKWETIYNEAAEGIPGVFRTVADAVTWANDLIQKIEAASSDTTEPE